MDTARPAQAAAGSADARYRLPKMLKSRRNGAADAWTRGYKARAGGQPGYDLKSRIPTRWAVSPCVSYLSPSLGLDLLVVVPCRVSLCRRSSPTSDS